MRRIPTRFVFALAAVVALASCGTATEKLTEEAIEQSAGGGEVDIDDDGSFSFENEEGSFEVDDEGNVKIEGEDGEFSIDGSSGELPDGWPDDVPVPDDLEILTGSKTSDGSQDLFSVVGTVDDEPSDAFADLVATFEDAGYETSGKSETTADGNFFATAQFTGNDHQVAVSVSTDQDAGRSTVSINVSPEQR